MLGDAASLPHDGVLSPLWKSGMCVLHHAGSKRDLSPHLIKFLHHNKHVDGDIRDRTRVHKRTLPQFVFEIDAVIMRLRGSQAGPRLGLLVLASVEASVNGGLGWWGLG